MIRLLFEEASIVQFEDHFEDSRRQPIGDRDPRFPCGQRARHQDSCDLAEEDKLALHRFKADESYQVGRGPHLARDLGPIESYLSIDEVIRVAKLSGADAIHPAMASCPKVPNLLTPATMQVSFLSALARYHAAPGQQGRRP